MKILSLAWRNVFRHRRRTVITAVAISVGLSAMIFMDSMMNGVDKMAAENIIDYETGHLEIFAKGYYREEGLLPLDTVVENPLYVLEELKGMKGIRGATPRIKFNSRITNTIDELPVLGVGIDVEKESRVFKTAKAVVDGNYLKSQDDLLIGAGLAEDMDLEVGSYVTVITRDSKGTYDAYDFSVSGILQTGHPLFDRNAVLMSADIARELLALPGATEICVRARDEHNLLQLKTEIADRLGEDFEVYTWKELNAALFQISGFKRIMQFLVAFVVVIIAAVGIINTMLMAVMERIPEIGTLRAMGFSNWNLIRMFLYEGCIIGIFGSLIGCFGGFLMSLYLSYYGIDLSGTFENMDIVYPMEFIIKGDINYMTILYVFIFGVVVSVLVTLLPVRKALGFEPVEALRHV